MVLVQVVGQQASPSPGGLHSLKLGIRGAKWSQFVRKIRGNMCEYAEHAEARRASQVEQQLVAASVSHFVKEVRGRVCNSCWNGQSCEYLENPCTESSGGRSADNLLKRGPKNAERV